MQEIYEKIVLDGSNIIHDDTGIEMKSDDGERLIQIRPERLLAAINHTTHEYAKFKAKHTHRFLVFHHWINHFNWHS